MQKRQAAQRAMAAASGARAARNKRLLQVFVPVGAIILIAGILIGISQTQGSKKGHTASVATAAVMNAVRDVPSSVTDQVGAGGGAAAGPTKVLSGPLLTANGKPKVLYVGAEFCPYCAAERWALTQALSRFGTLSNLGETRSAPSPEVYPDTATFTFHGSHYTSRVIALTTAEVEDGNHKPLEKLDPADNKLFTDVGGSQFPFIDVGGKYQFGVQYDAGLLAGKTQAAIADAMANPDSKIGQAIDGSANLLTAAICDVTNGQPSKTCSARGVTAAKKVLAASK
jgi:hypothetical protein